MVLKDEAMVRWWINARVTFKVEKLENEKMSDEEIYVEC